MSKNIYFTFDVRIEQIPPRNGALRVICFYILVFPEMFNEKSQDVYLILSVECEVIITLIIIISLS